MNKRLTAVALVMILLSGLALWAQTTVNRRYIYDNAGQLIGVIDEDGTRLQYTYDAAGTMLSVQRLSPAGPVDIFFLDPNRGRTPMPPSTPSTPVTIHGIGFSAVAAQNQVRFNGVPAMVDSATPTTLRTSVPAGATTGPVQVTSPLGSATSRSPFTVIGNIMVTVSPTRVEVAIRQGQQFTATVTEAGRAIPTNVTWSVNGITLGNPTVGTITPNGLYRAPVVIPTPPTVTVTATSIEEMASRGNAAVKIVQSIGPIFSSISYRTDPRALPIGPIFTLISYRSNPLDLAIGPIFASISYTSIVITDLNPRRVSRGAMGLSFTVTGRNFNGATAVDSLRPSDGSRDGNITMANLMVNPDGTPITGLITVAAAAAAGARIVAVRTPVGPSAATASASNQLMIE